MHGAHMFPHSQVGELVLKSEQVNNALRLELNALASGAVTAKFIYILCQDSASNLLRLTGTMLDDDTMSVQRLHA